MKALKIAVGPLVWPLRACWLAGALGLALAASSIAVAQDDDGDIAPIEAPAGDLAPAPAEIPPAAEIEAPLRPIVLQGRGQTATEPISLPASDSVAAFTHAGSRNFIVTAFVDSDKKLLVNTIGAYKGSRLISAKARSPSTSRPTAHGRSRSHRSGPPRTLPSRGRAMQ